MNTLSIPTIVMAGISLYVGIYHLLIYFKRRQDRENLTFALLCFTYVLYATFCAGLYNVGSVAEGAQWQRAQFIALAVFVPAFLWFVSDYTHQKPGGAIRLFSAYYLIVIIVQLVDRSNLTFLVDQSSIKEITLPYLQSITYYEAIPGPFSTAQGVVGMVVSTYILIIGIRYFRRGYRREAMPLIVAIILMYVAGLHDTLVSNGIYQFVYLIEYSYMAVILMMAYTLSDKVVKAAVAEDALRASEQRFRTIFDSVNDAIFIHDLDRGDILDINQTTCTMYGYAREEALQLKVEDLSLGEPPYTQQDALAWMKKAVTGGTQVFEWRSKTKGGRLFWSEINIRRVSIGGHERLLATARDITGRKLAEEALRARTSELEALYKISTALRATRTLDEMKPLVLPEIRGVFSADACAVILLDRDQVSFTITLADGMLASNTGRRFIAEESRCGEILKTRRPVVSDDITSIANQPACILGEEQLGPEMLVPLLSENEMLGILAVQRRKGRATFSPADVQLLTAIGESVGNSLHRARLYDQAVERLDQLQALRNIDLAITASIDPHITLDILLGEVITQLRIDAADVLLYNPGTLMLDFTAGRGLKREIRKQVRIGDGVAGRIAAERCKYGFADLADAQDLLAPAEKESTEGFAAYYGAPMVAKGQIIGVLEAFHRTTMDATPEWVNFLEAVATQAAIAIDNAYLFDRLQRVNLDLSLAYDATIAGWSRALDLREHETERHSDRVTDMTLQLARAMEIPGEDLVHIRRGSLLHDIGKMGIPDSILLKPGRLAPEERLIMCKHPILAHEMLSAIAYLRPALDIPYSHHERWDGSGYPRGLSGTQIPLAARIFAVVDVFDALTNHRPYRPPWPRKKALDYIHKQSSKHFDPRVVDLFMQTIQSK